MTLQDQGYTVRQNQAVEKHQMISEDREAIIWGKKIKYKKKREREAVTCPTLPVNGRFRETFGS